ncbi:hypothetical protein ACFHWD_14935 [Clostridium sp. MT-14]|jgi:flagellar biosynthesis protein FlhB|uniref:EscU/YscU/HrcU family type III secretion system export apparatus switch protein n=1 Tax=Clostridium aromativorans TaxID=2836848 RepID=A0ABS8NBM4_9CLOT|nr:MULTISPECIES: EscU/YscU/HrcU family type III secretion system export apparatus switch protein [Clostridium]KAA8667329.1 EscU/YscU/HrcU family type III secretion system export apparatus switch protein [Clostridium sp. HV4-5-A1G]MCC9296118.1 EscU/YscU/HrcU family type III secretion system export apparatus switch protein [Clostridium aromativorans]CAB1246351.1 conserved membrane hypothetical protein [Clostridiaceae bacterium BL-3]
MKSKKSNFLTVVFSFLPGAGHMYMGFMKMGLSIMAVFFTVIFFSSWLNIGPLLFILPLIWFYSFFDCINKQSMPQEEFEHIEDNYIFSIDKLFEWDKSLFKKQRLFFGILLICMGIYLIWDNIRPIIEPYIDSRIYEIISNFTGIVPQMIVGVAIIVIGVKLIMGKKKEVDTDD